MDMLSQEPIEAVVKRVWTQSIGLPPEWSPQQVTEHLEAQTERIETMIDDAVPGQGPLVAAYRQEHGTGPDYLTTVELINQARAQAREVILDQELYSLIPSADPSVETDPDVIAQEMSAQDEAIRDQYRNDPDRWKKALRSSEPTPEIVALTETLWSGQHVQLIVLAERLMQTRQEDGHQLPTSPNDPLFQEFSNLLDQELVAKGRAHAVYRP